MSTFEFNRIYVIESLEGRLTGKELYEDLLRRQEYIHQNIEAKYITINNKKSFLSELDKIKEECEKNNCFPILHFEIHGDNNLQGLVLSSRELVSWSELNDILADINSKIANNLFLTLAVCYGAYLMQEIKFCNPAPFFGFIGSFEKINEYDLMIRYQEFYTEFFSSFDINKALDKLHAANPDIASTYHFINSEETFIRVYKRYLIENFSTDGLNKRIEQAIKDENIILKNRQEKRVFKKNFIKEAVRTKDKYYREHCSIFFMFDIHPENEERFSIPLSLDEFQRLVGGCNTNCM